MYDMEMEDELAAVFGDPRRCARHPEQVTSSPDGMFDAPCGRCENEWEDAVDAAAVAASRIHECDERCVECVNEDRGLDPLSFYEEDALREYVEERAIHEGPDPFPLI